MRIADANKDSKPESLAELTAQVECFVRQSAAEGCTLRDFERTFLDRLLHIGRVGMDLFLASQGDGDRGDTIFRQSLSVDTLEQVSRQMGERAGLFLDGLTTPPADEEGEILVLTSDGKGIPMVHADAAYRVRSRISSSSLRRSSAESDARPSVTGLTEEN